MSSVASGLTKLTSYPWNPVVVKPVYFEAGESYVACEIDEVTETGLYTTASDERKRLISSFSLTKEEYTKVYLESTIGNAPLRLLLNTVFDYNIFFDEEVKNRFTELIEAANSFKEVFSGVYIHNDNEDVVVAFIKEGCFCRYRKGTGYMQYVVEDSDIYFVYEDGSFRCICDEGVFSPECTSGDVRVDKGYCRVWVNNKHFRSHTLLLALQYGVDIVKHTLGRYSLLTIDHINKKPDDNAITNLRIVTRKDNTLLKHYVDRNVYNFLDLVAMG